MNRRRSTYRRRPAGPLDLFLFFTVALLASILLCAVALNLLVMWTYR